MDNYQKTLQALEGRGSLQKFFDLIWLHENITVSGVGETEGNHHPSQEYSP